jgi:hypothetical protein
MSDRQDGENEEQLAEWRERLKAYAALWRRW